MNTKPAAMTAQEAEKIINARQRAGQPDTTCPACNKGQFRGLFYVCCDNPDCSLYSSFAMDRCGICGQTRRSCCC